MEKQCEHCKKPFKPEPNRKFCSVKCRQTHQNRLFYSRHKELFKGLWQEYYSKNKQVLLDKSRERYYLLKETNPERIQRENLKSSRQYRKTEKGKLVKRLDSQLRRNKTLGVIDKIAWLKKLRAFGGKCAKCGSSEKIQIDHIVPISRGGTNHITNLQPLCSHCNASKGSKIKDEEKVRHSK